MLSDLQKVILIVHILNTDENVYILYCILRLIQHLIKFFVGTYQLLERHMFLGIQIKIWHIRYYTKLFTLILRQNLFIYGLEVLACEIYLIFIDLKYLSRWLQIQPWFQIQLWLQILARFLNHRFFIMMKIIDGMIDCGDVYIISQNSKINWVILLLCLHYLIVLVQILLSIYRPKRPCEILSDILPHFSVFNNRRSHNRNRTRPTEWIPEI